MSQTSPHPRVAPIDATGHLPGELDDSELQLLADRLLATIATIRRSARRLSGGRPSELGPLTSAELDLVHVVRRRPGVSVAEAAHEFGVAPNTISTLVRKLTGAGIVSRQVDETDRRVARLSLVDGVREQVEASRDRRVEAVAAVIHHLSRHQQRQLTTAVPTLETLADGLETEWRSR